MKKDRIITLINSENVLGDIETTVVKFPIFHFDLQAEVNPTCTFCICKTEYNHNKRRPFNLFHNKHQQLISS